MSIILYYGEILVGYIEQVEFDFPSYVGEFVYEKAFIDSSETEQVELKRFLDLQAKYCELFDTEDEVDESEINQLHEQLEKNVVYLDSNKWAIDRAGVEESIKCPVVYVSGEISWR